MPADVVNDVTWGGLTLKQCVGLDYNSNAQVVRGRTSGGPASSAIYGLSADQRKTIRSADIAGIIAGVSLQAGLDVTAGSIVVPFHKRSQGGVYQSGSAHWQMSAANGLLIPTEFSASKNDEAVICSLEAMIRSTDGKTNPVTESTGNAATVAAFNAQYAFGPVTINGAQVPGCVGWTVRTGIVVSVNVGRDGGIYATHIFIDEQNPEIELQFEDFDESENFTTAFDEMTAAEVFAYKRDPGGTYVADNVAEHVKFSFTDGIITKDSLGGQNRDTGQYTLKLHGQTLAATATSTILGA